MNSLSYNDINITNEREKYLKDTLLYSKQNWVYNHFRVGEKTSMLSISAIYSDILCTSNCEIINAIDNKLTNVSQDKSKHVCEKIHKYKKHNDCSETGVCNDIVSALW